MNWDDMTRPEKIKALVSDLVGRFLYYDRKGSESMPMGEIEAAIKAGEISEAQIVECFGRELREGLR